jgi:hypothetical protein
MYLGKFLFAEATGFRALRQISRRIIGTNHHDGTAARQHEKIGVADFSWSRAYV